MGYTGATQGRDKIRRIYVVEARKLRGHSGSRPTTALHASFNDPERRDTDLRRDLTRLSTPLQDGELARSNTIRWGMLRTSLMGSRRWLEVTRAGSAFRRSHCDRHGMTATYPSHVLYLVNETFACVIYK